MHRGIVVSLLTLACALGFAAVPATAATRQQAQIKARQAANHYTNAHFGIGFATADGWRHWSASCRHRAAGGGWTCSVRMEGGQCRGSLKLTAALKPYGHRIGCLE